MLFTICTDKSYYKEFNGHKCKITNTHRDDGYYEVYIDDMQSFILLEPHELDGDT